jgi:spermidine synthase
MTIPYYRETPAAALYVKEYEKQRNIWGYPFRQLIINRHPTAHNSLLDIVVHKMLAHVPLLLHEKPESALVVGFGIGSTSYSMLRHEGLRVDCVELLEEEIETAPYFERANHDVINGTEPFTLIINDGRNYILATERIYDVVSVNAIDPRLSPALYTLDFYALCRARMTKKGVMALWLPTYGISRESYFSIYKSFQDVFPHSFVFYCNQSHFLIVGSHAHVSIDLARFREKASVPAVKESLGEVCLDDPLVLLSTVIMDPEGLRRMVREGVLNTDLNPTVEFDREEVANPALHPGFFQAVLDNKGTVIPYLVHDGGEAGAADAARIQALSDQLEAWMRGQFEYYTIGRRGARLDGMARMFEALNRDRDNMFLKVLLVTYSPSELGARYFGPFLEDFGDIIASVLEANPSMVMIHEYLSAAYARRQMVDEALEHGEAIARQRPDDWLFAYRLGGRYRGVGRTAEARACFDAILSLEGGRPWGLFGSAILLADQGDLAGAERRLREALEEKADFPEARDFLDKISKAGRP